MDFRSRVDSQPVASRYSSAVSYRSSPGRASPTRTTSPSRFISERAEALAASRSASASRRSSFDRSSSRDMGRYTSPGREAGSARYTSPGREAGGSTRYASPGRGIMSGRLGTGSPRRRTSMAGALGASPRVPRRDVGRGTAGDVRRWGVRDVGSWLARIDLAAFAQAFEERGVDGGALLRMDMSDDLLEQDYGITNEFHRLKLRRAVGSLQPRDDTPAAPATARRSSSASRTSVDKDWDSVREREREPIRETPREREREPIRETPREREREPIREREREQREPVASSPGPDPEMVGGLKKAARAAQRELVRVDGEWDQEFQVLLRQLESTESNLAESEARKAALEKEVERLSASGAEVGMKSNMQSHEYNNLMKMKLDLEQQNARLLEDKRRNDEDRANLERSTQQSTAEATAATQRLQAQEDELSSLQRENQRVVQLLTDYDSERGRVDARAKAIEEDRALLNKRLENKERETIELHKEIANLKAQLKTQELERKVEMEKVRELYEDALDEKETLEIQSKEQELKLFLLEEQMLADGETPVTRSLALDDSRDELEALRKNAKNASKALNACVREKEALEIQCAELELQLSSARRGDAGELEKLRLQVEETTKAAMDVDEELARALAENEAVKQKQEAMEISNQALQIRNRELEVQLINYRDEVERTEADLMRTESQLLDARAETKQAREQLMLGDRRSSPTARSPPPPPPPSYRGAVPSVDDDLPFPEESIARNSSRGRSSPGRSSHLTSSRRSPGRASWASPN